MADLIDHIHSKNLSDHVIEYVKEHSSDEETDCVQLLICKLSPFIKGMQESLKESGDEEEYSGNILFKYMPSLADIIEVGDECEEKHPYCRLVY